MNRSGRRRLAIKRETLRRLAAGELIQVIGGKGRECTYGVSGCQGEPQTHNHCSPQTNTAECEESVCC